MKLIPITNASSWKSDPFDAKDNRNDFRRRFMIDGMKPLLPLLRDLSPDPEDCILYELLLEENLKRAWDRDENDVDYSRLRVSIGRLPMTRTITVKSPGPGMLQLTWKDNSGRRGAKWTDKLFIALYHRASFRWIFELDIAVRADCKMKIDVFSMEGQTVYVYAGFVSPDRLHVSASICLGLLQIRSMGLGLRA